MIDIVALWVGRIVLGLVGLALVTIVVGCLVIGFQVSRKTISTAWASSRKKGVKIE